MNRRIGEVAFDLDVRNEEEDDISRFRENGMCDLVADAFREITDADICFINAGFVRNGLTAGEITFNSILNTLPYSNNVVVAEMKGQTLLDALEFGCRSMPVQIGGFPQVSGIEFTVDPGIESPVQTDEEGEFLDISGERRVSNVLIDGEPVDPEAVYTVVSTEFLITGGDHYKMFAEDAEIVRQTQKTDSTVLTDYIENNLHGVIPDSYQQTGERIRIINE